ncbi:MAG TPA: hypothetical protein DEA32_00950 [Firmicutes bacterium]|nr:hypothetical protein [Bacillota bacterium]
MDLREIFCTVGEVASTLPATEGLAKGMTSLDEEVSRVQDPTLLDIFYQVVGSSDSSLGYASALKFSTELTKRGIAGGAELNSQLLKIGRAGFEGRASIRLAQSSYSLMHWLMHELAIVNRPCHQLDRCEAKFTPMIQEDKRVEPNPYFTAYTKMVLTKPDAANNGYTNISTFLLDTSDDTAQTMLIRMGRCLWDTCFPMFSLYNPHGGSQNTADISADQPIVQEGAQIAGFIPLFIFLGMKLEFLFGTRELVAQFAFHPINPTVIQVSEGDKTLFKMEYLDDCTEPRKELGNLSLLEAIATSRQVKVSRPL